MEYAFKWLKCEVEDCSFFRPFFFDIFLNGWRRQKVRHSHIHIIHNVQRTIVDDGEGVRCAVDDVMLLPLAWLESPTIARW